MPGAEEQNQSYLQPIFEIKGSRELTDSDFRSMDDVKEEDLDDDSVK
jgi:hypothetical protein